MAVWLWLTWNRPESPVELSSGFSHHESLCYWRAVVPWRQLVLVVYRNPRKAWVAVALCIWVWDGKCLNFWDQTSACPWSSLPTSFSSLELPSHPDSAHELWGQQCGAGLHLHLGENRQLTALCGYMCFINDFKFSLQQDDLYENKCWMRLNYQRLN